MRVSSLAPLRPLKILDRLIVSCAAVITCSCLDASATAQETSQPAAGAESLSQPHPFGVHDMVQMDRLGAPYPSPDGQRIVFTVRSWDAATNQTTTNLWVVSSDGSKLRQLTAAKGRSDTSPTWSPDSRTIAFVSNRSGSQQLWTIGLDGGEAKQLTAFPLDVENLQWSPVGSHIAFSAEVYPDADIVATAQRDKAKADDPVKAMKFDRLFIRHWDSWEDGKRNHIFVLPVKQDEHASWKAAGEPMDLMKGVDADCPSKPFGGAEEFGWSPNGQEIAYTAQLGNDIAWSTDFNVFTVAVAGGPAKSITASNKATDTGPVYSPDGTTIAYRAMARPGFESDRYRIHLYDRKSGSTRTLTEAWDRSPGSVEWSPDGKSLLVTASDAARQKIFKVDATTGRPQAIVNEHYNSGASYVAAAGGAGGPRIAFAQDSLVSPAEIYIAQADGSEPKRLTHFNDQRVRLARMSEPAEFYFSGALGDQVQAWILKPVGFEEGKKYPVAFIIHGGPQGAIEDHFHYRWNLQAFTGAGFAVIAVNFHGSTGFGQSFTDSISGDWGGKPYDDLMKGLDYALANYSWLDADRIGALGASYGGWMVNWINGHTRRFKCLVNHDGGFDEFANYFTTEELWFPEWEFKGVPWERPELYDKFSPSRYISQWQTPTLVIHSAKDFRLVDAEGIATFTALQRRGIPSQLLYFPDENHWVLKPKNSIVWHNTLLAWLDKWLK
jgi:dipeptidyl aminopeptidase/acylaminoacyl peptidase